MGDCNFGKAVMNKPTNHPIDFRSFVAMVEAFRFTHDRTKGSHCSYVPPACSRPLVLQSRGKDAKRYQVAQFFDMVEEFSLTMDD